MRVVVREVEEERPLAVRVDEALGRARQVVLALAAFGVARLGRRLAGVVDVESLIARQNPAPPRCHLPIIAVA